MKLNFLGFVVDFFTVCFNLSFNSQIKFIFHSALLARITVIWFAQNSIRFRDAFILFSRAWMVVKCAIVKANRLNGDYEITHFLIFPFCILWGEKFSIQSSKDFSGGLVCSSSGLD